MMDLLLYRIIGLCWKSCELHQCSMLYSHRNSQQRLIHMLIDCLNHTDREEGWFRGIQNLMECKIYYSKIDATVSSLALDALSPAFILCLMAFSV